MIVVSSIDEGLKPEMKNLERGAFKPCLPHLQIVQVDVQ